MQDVASGLFPGEWKRRTQAAGRKERNSEGIGSFFLFQEPVYPGGREGADERNLGAGKGQSSALDSAWCTNPESDQNNHWVAVSPPEPDRTGSLRHAELGRESEVKFSGRKKKILFFQRSHSWHKISPWLLWRGWGVPVNCREVSKVWPPFHTWET